MSPNHHERQQLLVLDPLNQINHLDLSLTIFLYLVPIDGRKERKKRRKKKIQGSKRSKRKANNIMSAKKNKHKNEHKNKHKHTNKKKNTKKKKNIFSFSYQLINRIRWFMFIIFDKFFS